jgi:hypothetical protein
MKPGLTTQSYAVGESAASDVGLKPAHVKLSIAVRDDKPAPPARSRGKTALTAAATAWAVLAAAIVVALVTLAASGGWEATPIEMGFETVGVLIHRTEASRTP